MSQHVHLIGIAGAGLSAIARVLLESGYTVSGSDRSLSSLTHDLEHAGAKIFSGHRAENIAGADLVVRSSAVTDDNPEVLAARASGIVVLKRAEFIASLMAGKTGIAVAGTHGKTTTTAMIAWMFSRLGLDPSYIIGGISKNLSNNAHAGHGDYFVIEADEYDRMFLGLNPNWILLTHLEHDHPDCYPTLEEYRQAFVDFVSRLAAGGGLLTCLDHPETAAMAQAVVPSGCQVWTYGLTEQADYTAAGLSTNPLGGTSFNVLFQHRPLARIELQVPGLHNVRNALAALALTHRLHLSLETAAAALGEFSGTARRFDLLGEAGGVTIYNDYAHHPTEIRTTLAAARQRHPNRRIWAVWQPHTYSRTRALFTEFANAFADADLVIV
ncbi:MAG: UDP-N-acetylmuramate--L-alanine ligase, partial [Desulfobacterales bacterium]|nr:UDP-N-acetylmuramate--L-alanine ligase [Desulfobacterales bacterium]